MGASTTMINLRPGASCMQAPYDCLRSFLTALEAVPGCQPIARIVVIRPPPWWAPFETSPSAGLLEQAQQATVLIRNEGDRLKVGWSGGRGDSG
jgi:hypothetical protein